MLHSDRISTAPANDVRQRDRLLNRSGVQLTRNYFRTKSFQIIYNLSLMFSWEQSFQQAGKSGICVVGIVLNEWDLIIADDS